MLFRYQCLQKELDDLGGEMQMSASEIKAIETEQTRNSRYLKLLEQKEASDSTLKRVNRSLSPERMPVQTQIMQSPDGRLAECKTTQTFLTQAK